MYRGHGRGQLSRSPSPTFVLLHTPYALLLSEATSRAPSFSFLQIKTQTHEGETPRLGSAVPAGGTA